MKMMIEASGSLVSGYLINSIQESGNQAVATDVSTANHAAVLADDYVVMPYVSDPELWSKTKRLLLEHQVDVVIPSFDETLLEWCRKMEEFKAIGVEVILSEFETIDTFQDKWKTYQFFKKIGIPTPETSLEQDYKLVKPRTGRGGGGIYIGDDPQDMKSMISQDIVSGEEFTIDCFYGRDGKPVYIIPRKRLGVMHGKSLGGVTIKHDRIIEAVEEISKHLKFRGPINFQCFEVDGGALSFIECNPRVAGGMALGFAASENWMSLIESNLLKGEEIDPVEVKFGLQMHRYYAECFL